MTSHPSHRPVSAPRERMIEDMRVRGFTEKTRSDYVRNVRAFAAFIGRSPDTATTEDLRRFQPQSGRAALDPPAQPRRPCRCHGRRDQEASVAAHAAAQLCHAPAGAGHRYPRHSGAARNRDILPINTRSRGGFSIRFTLGAGRRCSLLSNTPTVALSWSSFHSLMGRSPAYPRG